ncbi:MAG: hypothetical protein IIB57_01055, partial [Planctomycetes bacterium]|nr:hypothetical protein [Planctomycetota bacterium]
HRRKILTVSILVGIGVCAVGRTTWADELILIRSGESSARDQDDRSGTALDDLLADGNSNASRAGELCNSVNDCPPLEQNIIDACGIYTCDGGICVLGSTCNVLEMCDGAASCDQIIFFDANLTYLAGPENEPFNTPFTLSDFESARMGQAPQLSIYFNDGSCNGIIPEDLAAAIVSTSVFVLDIPNSSALYAIDFEVAGPTIENASIDLFIRPNDTLGGGPNQGVYINGMPLSGDTTGGTCGVGSPLMNIYRTDIGSLLHVGTNTLYLNITHTGGDSGLLFTAEIRVDTDGPHLVHVDDDAPPGGDGTSWPTAFNSLQDAIENLEASADPNREIWLAGGVYKPTRLEDPGDPRSMTFRLLSYVDILGGFAGTERSRTERVAGTPPTIISGDINGDDVFTPTHPTWNENAYHIFTGDRFLRRVTIDNVTLTHGKANGPGPGEDKGSAIYQASGGNLTISQCTIDDNYSEFAGTIYLGEGGVLDMTSSSASGNISNLRHGFITALFESSVSLADCEFIGNLAAQGGVVSLQTGSSLVAVDCLFADSIGGGFGGAIEAQTFLDSNVDNSGIHITLTRCDFLRNQVRGDGGAIYYFVSGGGHNGSLTISDCTFDENTNSGSGDGGAIFATNNNVSIIPIAISGSTFTNGFAFGTGGAMHFSNFSSLEVTDCLFANNRSHQNGAAVFVVFQNSSFRNCSFLNNRSVFGNGVLATKIADFIEVTKCSFIGNAGQDFGGAMHVGSFVQSVDIVDSVFIDNTCEDGYGGAILTFSPDTNIVNSLFIGNDAKLEGGAISAWNSFLTLTNSTMYGNSVSSDKSGGLYGRNSFIVINNSIVRGNTDSSGGGLTGQVDGDATTFADINYSNVEGVALSDGNIDEDPLFIDPLGTDGMIGTEDDDFHLSPGSPSIDAGRNSLVPVATVFDLDGLDRFVDHPTADSGLGTPPLVDMGPYESRFADCDYSGTITLGDYAGFGICLTGPTAPIDPGCGCLDLDIGGTVDLRDYAIFQGILPAP